MEHIQIGSKLQLASISQDLEAIKTLEVLSQAAEQSRKDARQAILNHEAGNHPEGPPSLSDEGSESSTNETNSDHPADDRPPEQK